MKQNHFPSKLADSVHLSTVVLFGSALVTCAPCSDVECTDGLEISFNEPINKLRPVSFFVLSDLPLLACSWDPKTADVKECAERGLVLQQDDVAITGLVLKAPRPERLEIVISVDGEVVRDVLLIPHEFVVNPNGDECGPRCSIGYEQI